MSTLHEKVTRYKNEKQLQASAEKEAEQRKANACAIAKEILDEHGDKPFEHEGETLVVAALKGTTFLRTPLRRPGGKSEASVAS